MKKRRKVKEKKKVDIASCCFSSAYPRGPAILRSRTRPHYP